MREAARFLKSMRKITQLENGSWEDFLVAAQFDNLAKSALMTASLSFDDEECLAVPSTAICLSHDVKYLVHAKWGNGLN